MNVQDFPLNADDSAGEALIRAAGTALAKRRSDIPGTFLAELLGSAVPDDLQRYAPGELAAIAERSWSLFAQRQAGAPKISFAPAPVAREIPRPAPKDPLAAVRDLSEEELIALFS